MEDQNPCFELALWMLLYQKVVENVVSITYELLSHVVERSSSIVSLSKSLRI